MSNLIARLHKIALYRNEADATTIHEAIESLKRAAVIAEAATQEIKALRENSFPSDLSPPLRRILGMMLWETTPIAHAMRASGRDIPRKCEDEQAAVLHWLLGIVLEHGDAWQKHAAIELRKLTEGIGGQNVQTTHL